MWNTRIWQELANGVLVPITKLYSTEGIFPTSKNTCVAVFGRYCQEIGFAKGLTGLANAYAIWLINVGVCKKEAYSINKQLTPLVLTFVLDFAVDLKSCVVQCVLSLTYNVVEYNICGYSPL